MGLTSILLELWRGPNINLLVKMLKNAENSRSLAEPISEYAKF